MEWIQSIEELVEQCIDRLTNEPRADSLYHRICRLDRYAAQATLVTYLVVQHPARIVNQLLSLFAAA
jgi:hypothetical protein